MRAICWECGVECGVWSPVGQTPRGMTRGKWLNVLLVLPFGECRLMVLRIEYSTSQTAPVFSHTYLIEVDSITTQ